MKRTAMFLILCLVSFALSPTVRSDAPPAGPPPGHPVHPDARPPFLPPPDAPHGPPPDAPHGPPHPVPADAGIPEHTGAVPDGAPRVAGETVEPPKWLDRLEELKQLAEDRLKDEITERSVAQSLRLQYPVKPPTMSPEEVEEEIDRLVEEQLDDAFPLTQVEEFRREADDEFELWQIGDEVTLEVGGPRPRTIQGTLRSVNRHRIQVGFNNVPTVDLDDETLRHLLPEKLEEAKQRHVRIKLNQLHNARQRLKDDIEPGIRHDTYRAAHYVPVRGRWYPEAVVVRRVAQTRRQQAYPEVLRDVLQNNGFTEYEGEWIPEEYAEIKEALTEARDMDDVKKAVALLDGIIRKHPEVEIIGQAKMLRQELARRLPPEAPDRHAPHTDLERLRQRLGNGD